MVRFQNQRTNIKEDIQLFSIIFFIVSTFTPEATNLRLSKKVTASQRALIIFRTSNDSLDANKASTRRVIIQNGTFSKSGNQHKRVFLSFYQSRISPFYSIFHILVCCKHVQLDTIDQTVIEPDLFYPNTWEKKMVDTYTKRPIYELIGKNKTRYFLYWIKTDFIKTIEYPRSRTINKDGWIVR